MGNKWRKTNIFDVVEIISGGTPKTSIPEYWNGPIPWLSVGDYNTGFRWVGSSTKTITEKGLKESATNLLQERDIIISARGTVGVVAQLKKPMAFNQSSYGIRGKKGIADTDFIYYALKFSLAEILKVSYGGVFSTITRNSFKSLEIKLPPIDEQRKIAYILGSLDDKIELNRQMSKTLEETAQALFKSWFVDFEPVHAKVAGSKPIGLSPEIADLFPDSFVESNIGKIPKGWKIKRIQDIIERIPTGKKYEQKTSSPIGKVPILDQGQSGLIGYHNDEPGVHASMERPVIVFTNHTCYMRLIYYPFSTIQNVLPFVGKEINTIWLYYASIGKQSFVEYKGHWPDFIRHQVCVPNNGLDNAFRKTVSAMLQKTWTLAQENLFLSETIETLLPKLISGN